MSKADSSIARNVPTAVDIRTGRVPGSQSPLAAPPPSSSRLGIDVENEAAPEPAVFVVPRATVGRLVRDAIEVCLGVVSRT